VSTAVPFLSEGQPKRLFIDGQWVEAASGRTFETRNPATGEVLATVAEGDEEDVNRAVAAARRAFEGPWSRFTPADRQRALNRLAQRLDEQYEEFALLETLDLGAPLRRTLAGRHRNTNRLLYYAVAARTIQGETLPHSLPGEILSYTLKEPVGVVGGISPWNGPLGNSLGKITPVLATGCTLVLKPSEEAPLIALRLAQLLAECDIPPGVVNVVPGYGRTAGAAIAAHPDVDKIIFTGSYQTGREIVKASAGNFKRLAMEMGGKSPDVVFADADLERAIPGAAMATFNNTGQVCCAGTRLYVEEKIYDEFVDGVARYAETLRVGNGLDEETVIGPVVSERHLERVLGYVEAGTSEGARVTTGGHRLVDDERRNGYFVPPTVFTDVRDDMRIAREEIFGPVLSAMPFRDMEEVIRRSNDTVTGLGSYVWTRDLSKAHSYAKAVRAGSVWINTGLLGDPAVPFGGYKMSGYGREGGLGHLDELMEVKSVWINTD